MYSFVFFFGYLICDINEHTSRHSLCLYLIKHINMSLHNRKGLLSRNKKKKNPYNNSMYVLENMKGNTLWGTTNIFYIEFFFFVFYTHALKIDGTHITKNKEIKIRDVDRLLLCIIVKQCQIFKTDQQENLIK